MKRESALILIQGSSQCARSASSEGGSNKTGILPIYHLLVSLNVEVVVTFCGVYKREGD